MSCGVPRAVARLKDELTLLSEEETESPLQGNPLAGVLVVGREAGRVGGLGDLAVEDLLQRVDAVAVLALDVHQMHGSGCFGGLTGVIEGLTVSGWLLAVVLGVGGRFVMGRN